MRPLPQGAPKLLGLDLEAETGVEIEIITIIFVASSLPSVCGERQGRPSAAPPPALRPRAPLHGRRTADAQHVRKGKAQQRLLPGALVVSLMGVVEFFLSFFEFFLVAARLCCRRRLTLRGVYGITLTGPRRVPSQTRRLRPRGPS